MSKTDEFLENNQRYAESFGGPLPLPPSAGVAVVACMDARLNVYGILGLDRGRGARDPERRAASSPTTRSGRWPSASGCSAPARSS